jgi:DNA polymerase-4
VRERIVLYAEVPCFYAAIERRRDATLRDRPVVVGGDPRKRGQVQSASPEALAAGVAVGMPVLEALERCPRARAVRTDIRHYREVSSALRSCLRAVVPSLEPAGLDAAYLDPEPEAGDPESVARRLAEEVRQELALPLRVGIAPVKFLAKLAAEEVDPRRGGARRIQAGAEVEFLGPLPLGRLPGVGPKTEARLESLGARCIADVERIGAERLEAELGNHGLRILELARGEDASGIRAARHPRSLSQEFTYDEPQRDLGLLWEGLRRLAEGLEQGLRRQGLLARRVAVKVRYSDLETTTRSRTLARPVAGAGDIASAAGPLLDRTQAGARAVRGLGLAVSGLAPGGREDRQLELFTPER